MFDFLDEMELDGSASLFAIIFSGIVMWVVWSNPMGVSESYPFVFKIVISVAILPISYIIVQKIQEGG